MNNKNEITSVEAFISEIKQNIDIKNSKQSGYEFFLEDKQIQLTIYSLEFTEIMGNILSLKQSFIMKLYLIVLKNL